MAIFSPTPGFKGQPFTALGFITGNINFCVDVPEIRFKIPIIRRIDRERERQTDRDTERHRRTERDRDRDREAGRQTGRQRHRKTKLTKMDKNAEIC